LGVNKAEPLPSFPAAQSPAPCFPGLRLHYRRRESLPDRPPWWWRCGWWCSSKTRQGQVKSEKDRQDRQDDKRIQHGKRIRESILRTHLPVISRRQNQETNHHNPDQTTSQCPIWPDLQPVIFAGSATPKHQNHTRPAENRELLAFWKNAPRFPP
jgi:hypothetical protein